jgi:hypothetical protein
LHVNFGYDLQGGRRFYFLGVKRESGYALPTRRYLTHSPPVWGWGRDKLGLDSVGAFFCARSAIRRA